MLNKVNKEHCCGCTACESICPHDAIVMKEDREGFYYPCIDKVKCIECGLCERVCPIKKEQQAEVIKTYAVVNTVENERKCSSSGGVFIELAKSILEYDGVVYGAIFDENWGVCHAGGRTMESVRRMQGSKYVQSNMKKCYPEIKEHLQQGRKVLFTGTPCQNAGLRSYLQGKDTKNLYFVDIICHGVPSPKVWYKYLAELAKRYKLDKSQTPNFRDKREGWNFYGISIPTLTEEYYNMHKNDPYLKAFLKNVSLRPSCYNCHFKPSTSYSDMTIADFWEGELDYPDMFDDKGTSLVIINSNKGNELLEMSKKNLRIQEVDYQKAIKGNSSAVLSVECPSERNRFFKKILMGQNIELVLKQLDMPRTSHIIRRCVGAILIKVKNMLYMRNE